jgi:drug/metabolite transporter (DMT)-like permease
MTVTPQPTLSPTSPRDVPAHETTSKAGPPGVSWVWVAAALIAHTGWGIYPVLGRYMQTVSNLPSLSILVVGGIPMLLLMLFYVIPHNGWRIFRSHQLWLLGLVVVIRSITNLLAARFTLSIYVQLITLMTPFIVIVFSQIFLHEPAPDYTGRAILFSFIGAVMMMSAGVGVAGVHLALTASDWLGLGLAFGSAISLAFYMIIIRNTARHDLPFDAVLVFQSVVIMTSALAISLLIGEDWSIWLDNGPTDWLVVAAYILLVVFGANGLQIGALRHLGAPMVSSMMAWRLVSALILGGLLLGERLSSWWQFAGALLVLVTITWYLWRQRDA